jgi:DNA-binding response OmpR family regulator
MRILTADDDAISRAILTKALRSFGHEVVETKDGAEAWSEFRLHNFSLIISDWVMPNVDGIELCKRVREDQGQPRQKYTYIILLTSLEGKTKYLEGMEAGADDFINKPFDRDTLAARIRVAERILNLQAEVKQLEGLLPICAYCKKIKDDNDHWQHMESYISHRTEANFSHGICPDCYQKHMVPQLEQLRKLHKG